MKKVNLIIFIILVLVLYGYTEGILGINDIRKEYPKIFKVIKYEWKGKIFFRPEIEESVESHLLGEFINDNRFYISFLLVNSFKNNLSELEAFKNDPLKLKSEFIKCLKQDTHFTPLFERYALNFLIAKGLKIQNIKKEQEEISIDDVINIAVKFFYLPRILKDGRYVKKICVGINGLKETEKLRKPHIEAFCFLSIMNNIEKISPIFIEEVNKIKKLNLGIDDNERLLRAQGAIYLAMSRNESLKNILKEEYTKRKEYLPFIIK